jgi:hypothetical protein
MHQPAEHFDLIYPLPCHFVLSLLFASSTTLSHKPGTVWLDEGRHAV